MTKGRYDHIHVLLAKASNDIERDFKGNPNAIHYFSELPSANATILMIEINDKIQEMREIYRFLKQLEKFMDLEIDAKTFWEETR